MSSCRTTEATPNSNDFGWPWPNRKKEFEELAKAAGSTVRVYKVPEFQDGVELPIWRVPISFPKYRISNGRTVSAQQEYIASNDGMDQGFFNQDRELEPVQKAQHDILLKMIEDAGLEREFKRKKAKQGEPLILDDNGFVVNGNRRLCCWRKLVDLDREKYSNFLTIDIVKLPRCDEEQLIRLEAKLQIAKPIKSEYSWHAKANMYRQARQGGMSIDDVAMLYGERKGDVEDEIAKLEFAIEYLKSRNIENIWSAIKDDDSAFNSLRTSYKKKEYSQGKKDIFKKLSFLLIDEHGEANERLYSVIPKVHKYLEPVIDALNEEFLDDVENDDGNDNDDGAIFGGGANSAEVSTISETLKLVNGLPKSEVQAGRARQIILETLQSQDFLQNESKKVNILRSSLKTALTSVTKATLHGLNKDTSTAGVEEQIKQIRVQLDKIESWMKGNS